MGKKTSTRAMPALEFRESDFAGMTPTDQAELSGALNRLSEKLVSSRRLLRELEQPPHSPSVLSGLDTEPPPSNDDTARKRPK